MKLGDKKRLVEICYSGDISFCFRLQEVIRVAIIKVQKVFQHTGLGSQTIGFLCKLCDTNDHYCVLSSYQDVHKVSCSRNDIKNGEVTADMSCWIKRCG